MMWLGFIVWTVAVSFAWKLTARRPEYRPIAILLTVGIAADMLYLGWSVAVLGPLARSLGVAVPWTGWARVAGVVANALSLVWPASLVATALVMTKAKPWIAIAGWVLAVLAFVVLHPIAGDGSQEQLLLVVRAAAALATTAIGITWIQRPNREPATAADFALALVLTGELLSLLGAWRVGVFEHWYVSQALYLATFGMLIVSQGRYLCSSPQPSS
jgi:hypothetical protein